jgi:hypothetical protein
MPIRFTQHQAGLYVDNVGLSEPSGRRDGGNTVSSLAMLGGVRYESVLLRQLAIVYHYWNILQAFVAHLNCDWHT